MANSNPKNKWVAGQSGNSKGRPPSISPELDAMLRENKTKVREWINKYIHMTKAGIANISEVMENELPLGEYWLLKCMEKGANLNDFELFIRLCTVAYGEMIEKQEELTAEQRLALSLYDEWKHKNLQSPPVDREPE